MNFEYTGVITGHWRYVKPVLAIVESASSPGYVNHDGKKVLVLAVGGEQAVIAHESFGIRDARWPGHRLNSVPLVLLRPAANPCPMEVGHGSG